MVGQGLDIVFSGTVSCLVLSFSLLFGALCAVSCASCLIPVLVPVPLFPALLFSRCTHFRSAMYDYMVASGMANPVAPSHILHI
jgi:hypothetical protein